MSQGYRRVLLATLIALALALTGCDDAGPQTPGPTPPASLTPAPATTDASAAPDGAPSPTPPTGAQTAGAAAQTLLPIPGPPAEGASPADVAVVGGRVYTANRATNNVSVLEGGRVVDVVPVDGPAVAVAGAADSGIVFVATAAPSALVVLREGAVAATRPLARPPTVLAVLGEEVWVGLSPAAGEAPTLAVLSATNGAPLGMVVLSGQSDVLALAAAPDGGALYALTYGALHVVDVAARQEVRAATLPVYRTLAVSADGATLYLGEYDEATARSYLVARDAQTLEERARIEAPTDPEGAVVDPTTGRVFVASGAEDRVVAYDADLQRVLGAAPAGLAPRRLALDASTSRVYAAASSSDSVVMIDGLGLTHVDTVALRPRYAALWPARDTVYVAASSADRVYVLRPGAEPQQWLVGGYPVDVLELPERGQVAVLCPGARVLRLLDLAGVPQAEYPVRSDARDLYYDAEADTLYAGALALDLSTGRTEELAVPAAMGTTTAPLGVLKDLRRGRLWAVAHNGIPGSNGGYRLAPLGAGADATGAFAPGATVSDALYDPASDRFFVAVRAQGSCRLQAVRALDGAEETLRGFDGCAAYLALSTTEPGTLWVAGEALSSTGAGRTRLTALDTTTLHEVASVEVPGQVDSLALDAAGRLLVGSGDAGGVLVIGEGVDAATVAGAASGCLAPHDALRGVWEALGGPEGLGCATGVATLTDIALQPFEHGRMLWVGGEQRIYVLLDDGTYRAFPDAWAEGQAPLSCEADPAGGHYQPVRGFGLVWCREEGVREALGWGLEPESGGRALEQSFTEGRVFAAPGGVTIILRGASAGASGAAPDAGHWQGAF